MNSWTDAVGAIAAAGTLGVAVVAAFIGLRQVGEARRLREEQAQPYVFVDLRPNAASRKLVDLIISNVGATAAFNVKLAFDPPPQSTLYPHSAAPDTPLAEHSLFTEGLPYLPPKAEFRMLFEFTIDLYAQRENYPTRYVAVVTYDDSHGRACGPGTYMLDLTTRWNLLHTEPKTIDDVAKSLDKIEKHIGEIQQVIPIS